MTWRKTLQRMQRNIQRNIRRAARHAADRKRRARKPLTRFLAGSMALLVAASAMLATASSAQADERLVYKEAQFIFTSDHPDQATGRSLRWYKIGDYWQVSGKKPTYTIRANRANRKAMFPVFEKALGKRYNQYGIDNLITVMADGVLDQSPDRPWNIGTTRKLANELAKITDQLQRTGKDRPLRHTTASVGPANATPANVQETLYYPAGMYLVIDIANPTLERTSSLPMIVASGTMIDGKLTNPYTSATVALKNSHNADTAIEAKQRSASIGGLIDYEIRSTVSNPKPTFFTFEGQPGIGLTIDTASFTATANGTPIPFADYFTTDFHALRNGTDGNGNATFLITLNKERIAELAGSTIAVAYRGRVNGEATGGFSVENKVRRNVDTPWKEFHTVTTRIHTIRFTKIDSDGDGVQGASFTLNVENGQSGELPSDAKPAMQSISNSDGEVEFIGLKAGTYTCTETKPANGYLAITTAFAIELTDDGETILKPQPATDPFGLVDGRKGTVLNVRHVAQLPLSGAVGTTIFVAAGLVLAGVGVAVARRGRRSAGRTSL